MGKMFIFMDKPRATGWFEFGTILESRPASGFDFALPRPHTLNPCSPSSPPPLPFPQAAVPRIFISWESCNRSYPTAHNLFLLYVIGTLRGDPELAQVPRVWLLEEKSWFTPHLSFRQECLSSPPVYHMCVSSGPFTAWLLPRRINSTAAGLFPRRLRLPHNPSHWSPLRPARKHRNASARAVMHTCAGHRCNIGVFVCLKVLRQMFSLPDEISARVCGSGFVKAWSISAVEFTVSICQKIIFILIWDFLNQVPTMTKKEFLIYLFFYSHPFQPTGSVLPKGLDIYLTSWWKCAWLLSSVQQELLFRKACVPQTEGCLMAVFLRLLQLRRRLGWPHPLQSLMCLEIRICRPHLEAISAAGDIIL